MSNWFASIGQAASGLNAARYGLTVVSQNVANADTPGYSRQLSTQVADVIPVTGMTAPSGKAVLTGVRVVSTDRADDPVLDARVRSEHARGAATASTATTLTNLEGLFPEPSDTGLASQLNSFWAAWGNLANNPGDAGTRSVLLTSANTVADTLHSMSSSLSDLATNTSADLSAGIATANTTAAELATVNGQITVSVAAGNNANALLDQRDQLLSTLTSTVGGTVSFDAAGAATVTVGGQPLVSGATATTMSVNSSYQVSVGGTAVTLATSSAGAQVTALTSTLPGYRSQLDGVADTLSATVNSIQAGGYDLSGATGAAIFTGSGAAGISVALTDPNGIAASATAGGNLDGSNALAASKTGASTTGADARYSALVGDVAMASSLAQQQQTTQATVVTNVDNLKASVNGVSYDEEVSNMLTYQRAFEASSKVLTTLDSMLDTLINHTGVG